MLGVTWVKTEEGSTCPKTSAALDIQGRECLMAADRKGCEMYFYKAFHALNSYWAGAIFKHT